MILSRPLIRAVLRGEKNQHRQPRRPAYKPGRTIAVRPPGAPGDGTRLHILEITPVRLGDITFEQARAEGYKTTADFAAAWVRHHDKAWVQKVEEDPEVPADEDGIVDIEVRIGRRFTARHANRTVWLVTFEVDHTETERYVAAGWPDYTSSPALGMAQEPQPVDEATQIRITERAGTQYQQWKALEAAARDRDLEQLSLGQQLDHAIEEARLEGRSATRDIRVIEQRIRALQRRALPRVA